MGIGLQLLRCLSNGHFHSGESLARQLGVSRTTIWKEIKHLEDLYSVEVQSVKGRGYRLSRVIELLDEAAIINQLPESVRTHLRGLEILPVVDSTNRYLMAAGSQGALGGQVILAEQQTAGRGRQGRVWVSPFGCNIYGSLLWRFNLASSVLSGLAIAVAVAVNRALSGYCGELKIKWPNDIMHAGEKVAGILLEMQAEANGPAYVVIGVGINVRMPASLERQIDQPWTDLFRLTGKTVSRNQLAADLISQLIQAIQEFEKDGLENFITAWQEQDMLLNQQVEINLADRHVQGIACGIDATGALQVQVDGHIKSFMAGEASLKRSARMTR